MTTSRMAQSKSHSSHGHDHDHHGPSSSSTGPAKCSCGNPVAPPPPPKKAHSHHHHHHHHHTSSLPSPSSKGISSATALRRQRELREFAIIDKLLSKIFWLRFYEDAARLYSARLTLIAKERLPFLIQNIIAAGGGPGWACANAASDEVREYFRQQIQVDLRELEDRLWHTSSEWTYTAVRRMAITNGVVVSSAGLRASDLLTLIPLLEAMCKGLENAPKSTYEIHPVRAIAATFVNLYPNLASLPATTLVSSAKKKILVNHKMQEVPSLCTHHPSNKCAMDGPGSPAWGPALFKITNSAMADTKSKTGSSAKLPSSATSSVPPISPASVLFDTLFPSIPLSPKRASSNSKTSVPPTPTSDKSTASSSTTASTKDSGYKDSMDMVNIVELRSILSLGLSRLFIVLFQTAQEFNLRSFGENINLAFGAIGGSSISAVGPGHASLVGATGDGGEDDEYYGGCECCLEDFYDDYNRKNGTTYDDPLYDFWDAVSRPASSPYGSRAGKRKSAKRARLPSEDGNINVPYSKAPCTVYDDRIHRLTHHPYTSERSSKAAFYRRIFSTRPGAGLRAWDTVLHYEAVVREEEEEKQKKEEDRRAEKEKYGLKASTPTTPTTTALLQNAGVNALKENTKVAQAAPPAAQALDAAGKPKSLKRRAGKEREGSECDGRGGGLIGWNSCHEEDVWERDLDSTDDYGIEDYFGFGSDRPDDDVSCRCRRIAMRYLVAEEYKEDGNAAFKRGNFEEAIELYTLAHKSEPRLPIYLLNRSMAELKLYRWDEAEMDCTAVLRKHRTNAKALWRRAKARRATAQLTGDVEKLIAAERDLLDFLSLLPTSAEGQIELASVRAELCPCFECSERSVCATSSHGTSSMLFCSTSSTAPPRSCFNKNYRPPALLASAFSPITSLQDTPLARSADVLVAPPKGWLSAHTFGQTPPATPSSAAAANGAKGKKGTAAAAAPSQLSPSAAAATAAASLSPDDPGNDNGNGNASSHGALKGSWQRFVENFSFLPASVSSPEDKMPLRFVSDHDLASSTLPCWDLYRIVKAGK